MKKKIFYLFIIFFINTNSFAKVSFQSQKTLINSNIIKEKMNCNRLVDLLGGLNQIELLWLGNLNEEKFQFALINNTGRNTKKIFYLCENSLNKEIISDQTLEVLSNRNLLKIYYNSSDLFADIFSLTSKESRNYIMSTLNLRSFNITKNEINQAYIAGLMKINQKTNKVVIKKQPKKDTTTSEIVNVTEPKEEKFVPKKSSDKTPPTIIIAKSMTVNNYSYILKGKVKDTGSKNLYIEIDGMIQQANNGEFSFKRFSPIDEKVTIVAIDQWGNRSKATTVNIIMDIKNTEVVKKIEKLDPFKIKANKLNNNKVALIIGIENYAKSPNATYANLDAKYFYEYVKNTFGVKTENIKLMINQEANLVDSLGALNKWLPGKVRKNQTDLIIYFAGHGLASSDGKELYLLPQDGDSDLLERTALSRTEIFQMIKKLSPKSVTMFLDTCYSGQTRDEETLLASARPVRIVADEQDTPDNFTIFSASQLDQISSGFKEAKHGIFSYYLMKGLEGMADSNKDKKITNGELLAYMDQNVAQKASELGRQQNPSLAGDPDKILMSYR